MEQRKVYEIPVMVRDFLFSKFNREFLIFLFFLVLSAAYWVMSVLNDTMEREIEVPVVLTDIPQNVVVLDDTTTTLRVVVRDKGYTIAAYYYLKDRIHPLKIKFGQYSDGESKVTVTAGDITKQLQNMFYNSTIVTSVRPMGLTYHFNYGLHTKVPVRLLGDVSAADSYSISRVEFEPDSIEVYASAAVLDNITSVYTVKQHLENVSDTIITEVRLKQIKGVKFVPNVVTMKLFPDVMVEQSVAVPVTMLNVPEGVTLRTFPAQAMIIFTIGAAEGKTMNASNFVVEADYNSLADGQEEKCTLHLQKSPKEARNPRLVKPQVDYIIER